MVYKNLAKSSLKFVNAKCDNSNLLIVHIGGCLLIIIISNLKDESSWETFSIDTYMGLRSTA